MAVRLLLVLVLVATVYVSALNQELANDTDYIITFPESLTVRVDYQDYNVKFPESSAVKYGRFQCATRAGVHPLWLIDAVSAASIKTKLGFENVSYSVYSLPENGTFTLLYVPGYIETNNSRIRCAAFADGKIIEYSDIAYFTVYCTINCSVTAEIVYTEPSASTVTMPTNEDKTVSLYLIPVMTVIGLLLVLLSALAVVMIVWCLYNQTKVMLGNHVEMETNIYWSQESRGGQVLLKGSGNDQGNTETKQK